MDYKKLLRSKKFKIAVWGTGYIGLSTMVYFSKKKIKCVGSFLKKGRTISTLDSKLFREDGKLAAYATSTWKIL